MGPSTTADWYLRYADQEARGESATYEEWARGVAADPEVLGLLGGLPEQKRQPALVFATSRLLGAQAGDWPSFRRWLTSHWTSVAREAERRTTQTNEPHRCAAVLPALSLIPQPIALLEVGASAGLTLLPDRYAYRYDDVLVGDSPLVLECATAGSPPLPEVLPDIRWRHGVDLHPLDVGDADDVRWLEVLVPPEQTTRRDRIREAVRLARLDPPQVDAGDAVDALRELVARVPADLTPVVLSAGTMVYVPGRRRQLFRELVRELGCRWVAMERVGVFPDLVPPRLPTVPTSAPCLVTLDEQPLAVASPHGRHLAWL
ncbi:DUF2332 domain-containing protein [Naasia sp. SYSU D00948]|uniref:DUF2332 domain-containing protein n=1 Tax=Naasia sp. SYSU D00948 TaxID=2817379 RepID=UPI001B3014E2|nr:DUF2332 domain-containing protein [Naasia sp. SYSU D00948]